MAIVFLSVLGIVLEELKSDLMPINPTIMRVMRVLRIARGKLKNLTRRLSIFLRNFFFRVLSTYIENNISFFLIYSTEIVENGQRNSCITGYSDASLTSSW